MAIHGNLENVVPGTVSAFLDTLNSNFDKIESDGAIISASLADGAVTASKIAADDGMRVIISDLIYPVGSLYWAAVGVNPNSLFNGDWVTVDYYSGLFPYSSIRCWRRTA